MKRLGIGLMVCALLCLCGTALAQQSVQAVTTNMQWMDRVRLRARPDTDAPVLGRYFADVRVTVLEKQGDWWHVRVDEREGYMMSQYLTPDVPTGSAADEGIPGWVLADDRDGPVPLYASPGETAAELAAMPEGTVRVLGTVDENWLHIRYDSPDGRSRFGYASSRRVSQTDNMSSAVIDTRDAAGRLHLRASPTESAASLGRYYCGVQVTLLFDNHDNEDGWSRVRILDTVGYMKTLYLDDSSGGGQRFFPPLSQAKQESVPLFSHWEDRSAAGSVTPGDCLSVLGERGSRYAVRVETDEPYQYRYGYVEKTDVTEVRRAARATCTLNAAQPLMYPDGANGMQPMGITAPAGALAVIYGSLTAAGDLRSPYIDPSAAWISCTVELEPNHWADGCVPLSNVTYDSALAYSISNP